MAIPLLNQKYVIKTVVYLHRKITKQQHVRYKYNVQFTEFQAHRHAQVVTVQYFKKALMYHNLTTHVGKGSVPIVVYRQANVKSRYVVR